MSELLPEREGLRRAIAWIAERRKDEPSARLAELIEEASQQYDLGPLDQEFLWQALTRKP